MEYTDRIENARKIIEYNRSILYHISSKYPYLRKALDHEGIRSLIFGVYTYVNKHDFFIYRGKYVFFLDNKKLTGIRKATTLTQTSKYMNYVCAIGVFNKQYQNYDPNGEVKYTELSQINRNFIANNEGKRLINHYSFKKYTKKELERMEDRARQLFENKISPGNISCNQLKANNCKDLANEVFFNVLPKAFKKKEDEYQILIDVIDLQINRSGATTKDRISAEINLNDQELEKLFRIYKNDLNEKYSYKAPTKQESEKYKTKKWLFKRKGVTNGK